MNLRFRNRTVPRAAAGDGAAGSPRRILREPDAARYVGLSERQLQRLRAQGGGPRYARLGPSPHSPIGYPIDELDAWLRERTFATTSAETAAARVGGRAA